MSSEWFEVRKLSTQDVSEILLIQAESNLSYWSEESYKEEAIRADTLSFVAINKYETVGFIVARILQSESHNEVEIYNFGVLKKYQKLGVGSKLLQKLFTKLGEKKSIIWLEVRKSNIKALNFYEKYNFEKIGTRKNFFSNPTEDAILMKCEI